MKQKIKKIRKDLSKKIPLIVLGVFLIFIFSAQSAQAAWWDILSWGASDIFMPLIVIPLKIVAYLAQVIVGLLVKFAGALIGVALTFNTELVEFKPPFIPMAWTLFRDIANLGFVLGIILIAVATILRVKGYEAKNILWRLIVAALLVNFSLTFCAMLVKVSDIPTKFFMDSIMGGSVDGHPSEVTAKRITETFNLPEIMKAKENTSQDSIESTKEEVGTIFPSLMSAASAWISVIVFFLIFLVLFGLAGALFLRFFWLSFLIILSPAVCLLWVFPSTKKHFTDWWDKFLKQLLFAPFMLLFVYITLRMQDYSTVYRETAQQSGGTTIGLFGMDTLVLALMPAALLIGGMMAAKKMGHAGSGMALNAWEKGSAKTKEWAKTKAKRTGASLGNKVVGSEKLQNKLGQWGQSNNKFVKWSGAGILSGALGRAAIQGENKLNKIQQGSQEDIKKKYGNLSTDDLKKILPTFRGKGQAYTAILQMLADKDALGGALNRPEDLKNVQAAISNLKSVGKGDAVAPLLKKLGMNEKALEHLVKYNEGGPTQAASLAAFKSETDTLFSNMEVDDFKAFAKNNANSLENNNFFGLPSTAVDDMRGFTDNKMVSDETLISAYAPKIKDATKLKEFNARIIEKKLQWFENEKNARGNKLATNSGTMTTEQIQKEKDIINDMDIELKDFKAKLTTAKTSGKFDDLVKTMREKSTSSTSEIRDFAKRIRIK